MVILLVTTTRNPAWSTQAVPPFIYLEKHMSVIFTCEQCSIQFAPSRSGQVRRFCGSMCSRASRPRKTTTCVQCGESTTNSRFCSKSCSATYSNLRRLPMSAEQRQAISKTLKARKKEKLHGKTILSVHILQFITMFVARQD